jgi:type IV pilus assembly protein PilB
MTVLLTPRHPFFCDNLLQSGIGQDESLINLVDQIISHAIQQSSSDIHIEPFLHSCRIRYRRDGMLYEVTAIPANLALQFITRLKVMAQLDITERRLPQDGRFKFHAIDVRINTCPTLHGEKIVLRLLNANNISLDFTTLGFNEKQKNLFLQKISKPQGMVLVTGPTGSGKTITLYSALNQLNTIEKNISTVEDPIEIQLNGINQININSKIGLTFANALRTLLRQDPDILMVGEIRDQETAAMAIQAAQTGHLVLSTLHTNNALETITRLKSMGVTLHDIINSVSLIISQRLLRKLCPHCKQSDKTIFYASSCPYCLNGYHGRVGIYEFLPLTKKITDLLLTKKNSAAISQQLQQTGYTTLHEAGMHKVQQGITSMLELNRVVPL